MADTDWKKRLGIQINYSPGQSSDEDDIVIRNTPGLPRGRAYHQVRTELLLDDSHGVGTDADMLGTTPPRSRIRDKERKRQTMGEKETSFARLLRNSRRNTVDSFNINDMTQGNTNIVDDRRKRRWMKVCRGRARDSKVEFGVRADSMPVAMGVLQPAPAPATLVETCNRFMSLSSKPVCSNPDSRAQSLYGVPAGYEDVNTNDNDAMPANRVQFHRMFSMLIKMGSSDKSCRRTISMEEQTWQNELKDLIWLEIRAKLAGQTPSQHDAALCAQRKIVPTLIQNIINYRFINEHPCNIHSDNIDDGLGNSIDESSPLPLECLSISCDTCSEVLGVALKEVGTLLDSFSNAESLYQSSKAMAAHHPLIATQLFSNRLKALCLWYNIAQNLRLSIVVLAKLLKILKIKMEKREKRYLSDSSVALAKDRRPAPDEPSPARSTPTVVKFDLDPGHSADSNSSGAYSEISEHNDGAKPSPSVAVNGELSDDSKPDSNYQSNTDASDSESLISGGVYCQQSPHIDENKFKYDKSNFLSIVEGVDIYNIGTLRDVTYLKLYGNCKESPYRIYIETVLKTKGLRTALSFVNKLYQNVLKRAHVTLQKFDISEILRLTQDETKTETNGESESDDEKNNADQETKDEKERDILEMKRYGCWSEESLQMKLPSYRGPFIFLAALPLELIHEHMLFRLETKPEKPSALSIKQLIYEMKDALNIAAESRALYVNFVDTALESSDPTGDNRRFISGVVRQFDVTMEKVLKQYILYLSAWSEMEHLPRTTLEKELIFSLTLTKKMRCGGVLVPITFCSIITNQLNSVTARLDERFKKLDDQLIEGKLNLTSLEGDSDEDKGDNEEVSYNNSKKKLIFSTARTAQAIFSEERNVTLGAAQFARSLCSHLPLNIRYSTPMMQHLHRLYQAMLNVSNTISNQMGQAEFLIVQSHRLHIKHLCEDLHVLVKRVLLHGYKFGFDFLREFHYLMSEPTSPSHARISCKFSSMIQPDGVVRRRPPLRRADSVGSASQLDANIISEVIKLGIDNASSASGRVGAKQMSFDDSVLCCLKNAEINEMTVVKEGICDEDVTDDRKPLTDTEFRALTAKKLIEFAKSWMKFVTTFCDRGRGLRPRWASNGLEFLMLVCDPHNTKHLSNEEFEELKTMMDGCISHVVGSSNATRGAPATGPAVPHRPAPPPPTSGKNKSPARPYKTHLRHPQHSLSLNTSMVPDPPTPPTPPIVTEPIVEFPLPQGRDQHQERVLSAIYQLEAAREEALRELGSLGRPVSVKTDSSSGGLTPEPKLRQLNFQWQRGIKIGAGRFGKVYTVVNTESGQLLAMKEVSLGPGDWKDVQKAANELKVLEGVLHPHLVRYYGCEIYREEMLIFMELCMEGSLDGLLAHVGAPGLPELQVRRYAQQLVVAVEALHRRQIAHRDIKTANIFLTNEGHCLKLGDFGCAVKIRSNTTVPGELQGYVGTQAYMAPEVFMKSSGHGRLADVWSVGCVITEMASGKRPFSEYDSNYQIMFVVGMGGRPEIPSQLSQEGQEFCISCLTHELCERPRAIELLGHHFLMVDQGECQDCQNPSPPTFSTTKKTNFEAD